MRDVERAADAALRGELIVLPTDTVYGVGTRPDDPAATARVFEAKRRPRGLELPILVPSVEEAARLAAVTPHAGRAMEAFWPGPLTIVLRRSEAAAGWDLGGDPETIGLRWPRHSVTQAVLELTGPLAITSANLSGAPTPPTCAEVEAVFGEAVSVYVCDPAALTSRSSTVVDLTGSAPVVLRMGAIDERALSEALRVQ